MVTIAKPTDAERTQNKGRIDSALIEITRGSEDLIVGYIENVENNSNFVTYSGRSFLVLLGYSTSSETTSGGDTKAEYENDTGATIITSLLGDFCVTKDAELTYTDIDFDETYDGEVKLHGKKVYQIVKEMCSSYGKDIYTDATWTGNSVTAKNIHIKVKERGSSGSPYKTLHGGVEIAQIPTIVYKADSEMINCLRVIGKGEGKDQISVWCEDETAAPNNSIDLYGYIEGQPYRSNMISKESTAANIGAAIIAAKKDPITQLHVDPAFYINDLKYGDWVKIIDSYSGINTTKRIKKIIQSFNSKNGEMMEIELGDKFNNYENIIADLTKGDVDSEKEMTLGGGSFRITPNTPASDWVRIDKGSWYGTDGVFYEFDTDTSRVFWGGDPPYNATTVDNYFKALIQIKDNAISASDIEYKTNLTAGSQTGYNKATAIAETISPDSGYTPIGEIILKCKINDGTVYDIEATDEGGSFIYRDVRPIIGSSSTGFGGLWEKTGSPQYTQLISGQNVYLQGMGLMDVKAVKGLLNDDFILYGSNSADTAFIPFLKWDHVNETLETSSVILRLDYDNTGTGVNTAIEFNRGSTAGDAAITWDETNNQFEFAAIKGSVYAPLSAERIKLWSESSHKAGDIQINNTSGNMEFTDTITGTKTLGELTGGTGLWEVDGTETQLITADNIDMQGEDILKCKNIKGQTTGTDGADRLNLDFRGDANHRIYFTGITDNRLKYETWSGHLFSIQSVDICQVHSAGINMASGKYIKSDSGDLELRAPSGSKIKFVIG